MCINTPVHESTVYLRLQYMYVIQRITQRNAVSQKKEIAVIVCFGAEWGYGLN